MCILTAKHGHWILLLSFCLNQLYVYHDSNAWPLDCIGIFLSESLACALWKLCMATGFYWCLFDWITCMCIMTAMHVHWILLVSFCLNQLYVHYDRYAWPLDSIGVFLSESLVCALWQLCMSTGFCWCRFVWITCMCIMTSTNGHWILLVSFCLNHLYLHYDEVSMSTGFYWCLFLWITCICIMTAKHGQ